MTVPTNRVYCEIGKCSSRNNVGKYKCPRCFLKYCSLNCWKEHSKAECKKVLEPCLSMEIDTGSSLGTVLFPTDDTIKSESLERLKYDKQIKEMLRNHSLRQIIEEVDKAKNVRNAMQQAMMEPIFVELADKCLELICQPDKYESDSED